MREVTHAHADENTHTSTKRISNEWREYHHQATLHTNASNFQILSDGIWQTIVIEQVVLYQMAFAPSLLPCCPTFEHVTDIHTSIITTLRAKHCCLQALHDPS